MSLKVWFPLNGDLHNQGCSNIKATSIDTVINDNGKIGKCYYCNSSYSRIYSDLFTPTTNNFSMCCWYKADPENGATGYIMGLSKASDPSFMLYKYGNTQFRLYIDGSSNYTHNLDLTTWHHLTITYNGTEYCLYVDGVYKYKRTKTVDYTNNSYRVFLNCRSNNSNTSGAGSYYGGPNTPATNFYTLYGYVYFRKPRLIELGKAIINGEINPITTLDWFYGGTTFTPTGEYQTLDLNFKRVGYKFGSIISCCWCCVNGNSK